VPGRVAAGMPVFATVGAAPAPFSPNLAALVAPRSRPFSVPFSRAPHQYDRYIPNRDAMDFDASADALLAEDGAGAGAGRPASACGDARILAFRAKVG